MSSLAELVAKLAGDLGSPRVVGDLDRVLVHLLNLRLMAADLHGVKSLPPVLLASDAKSSPSEEAPQNKARPSSDLDVAGLVNVYRNDPRSPYHQLRHRTRENYNSLLRRIIKDCGEMKLADLSREEFERLYEMWKDGSKVAMAHALITMLRSLISFGAAPIEDAECLRLSIILHKMKFEAGQPRIGERLTEAHAIAIRAEAHKLGFPSIALAQAFQFDCKMEQKDAIGEWAPLAEQGPPSAVTDGKMKWFRGLVWSEIDENFKLKHVSSANEDVVIERDLKTCSMVMEELRKLADCKTHEPLLRHQLPSTADPIIIDEDHRKPYMTHTFRRRWRDIARGASVPDEVQNRDSRRPNGKWSAWQRAQLEAALK